MPTPNDISPFSSRSRAALRTFIFPTRSTSRVSNAGNHRGPRVVNSERRRAGLNILSGADLADRGKMTAQPITS
jgi:hypothetical protein